MAKLADAIVDEGLKPLTVGRLKRLLELEDRDDLEVRVAWGRNPGQATVPVVSLDVDLVNNQTNEYELEHKDLARPCMLIWARKPEENRPA